MAHLRIVWKQNLELADRARMVYAFTPFDFFWGAAKAGVYKEKPCFLILRFHVPFLSKP